MDKLFLTILNMSFTGAFVIAGICIARLPLRKAPKIISYCLWAVAGFRLLFPFSIESVLSLIPFNAQPIPMDIAMQATPRINSGISFINNSVSSALPSAVLGDSVNPLQIWTFIGSIIWVLGAAVMLIYGVVSYVMLKQKMRSAVHKEANIYEAENIKSPFLLGIFAPMIYLPAGISENERGYVILHEQTHIERRDYLVKFIAYFILCLHWFNPLAWAAFLLMGADMEMSCDERVLKEMGGDTKKDYSLSLLSLATERRAIGGSPLAFGEGGVKERIKNILKFKKPSRVITITAAVLAVILSVGFAVNQIRPFKDLSANDIASATVVLRPPDETFSLNENDIRDLVNTLRSVVTYVPDESYKDYAGQWVEFNIVKSDGAELTVAAYNPFIIIDSIGYKTKYEPCEELNRLGNQIMDSAETANNVVAEATRMYYLENMTEKQQNERLSRVTLYPGGKAELATPLISSYLMPDCTYSYTDNELLIYANIKTDEDEGFFGLKNGEVIANFEVADDNTLVFKTSAVHLFADESARYIRYAAAVSVNPSNLYALSEMRTPFVGNNSAVGSIVGALPGLDDSHTQRFFSIGDDYGTDRAPNTLTIYYEPSSPQTGARNLTNVPRNSALLFALIDNLEEVSFAFRETPSGNALDELNKTAYKSSVMQNRDDITEYLKTIGLDWQDFQNDWDGSVEKLYTESMDASTSRLVHEPNVENVQTVVYENVEMRRYTESRPGHSIQPHPYIHEVRTNNSDKTISGQQRGMLAFDKDGNPLKIDWFPADSNTDGTYFFLYDWGTEKLAPYQTEDAPGGWSLNTDGNDPVVEEIAYVLYCYKQLTFADETVWDNPDFEDWILTYEGKTIDVSKLNGYYPYVQEIGF